MLSSEISIKNNCLTCPLEECNESHKDCTFGITRRAYWTKINRARRKSPIYRTKEYKALQAWRKTAEGKMSVKGSSERYRERHRVALRDKARLYWREKHGIPLSGPVIF